MRMDPSLAQYRALLYSTLCLPSSVGFLYLKKTEVWVRMEYRFMDYHSVIMTLADMG
jgi:hypothetical protein